ncbi:hypothetical protein RvY_05583 [Ramazzottius varieornatus]|uniref:Uncharacterized protein n=1 Tax=Ramazzottius varieornatus TaxID=947166 RepID=A0A1D1UZ58_RAMVA|nr:hypothetical protein RvY_05583 [Ramazzottius varieornatus]
MTEDDLLSAVLNEYLSTPAHDDKSAKEKRLEEIVLGRSADFVEALSSAPKRPADFAPADDAEEESANAWIDEDDADNLVSVRENQRYKRFRLTTEKHVSADELARRLRNEYEKNLPTPAWALQKPQSVSDASDPLTNSTGSYVDSASRYLPLKNFQCKRLTNLNYESPAKNTVHALEFHPTAQMALVASFDHSATLFEVDGKTNPKLKSVYFEGFPISCAHFLNQGSEFLACSKAHSTMYLFDLLSEKTTKILRNKAIPEQNFRRFSVSPDYSSLAFPARDGLMHILSGRTREWLYSLKTNGAVNVASFSGDSKYLYSVGDGGRVHVWDLRSRACSTSFVDEGCVVGTAAAVSPNDAYLAIGSNSGVVNVYDKKELSHGKTVPMKSVMNLTTQIDFLKFNPTSELLALGSNHTHGAMKLLHMTEMQIVASFPGLNDKVRKADVVDFSLNSGYMAVGNNKGEALLYRLGHYSGF